MAIRCSVWLLFPTLLLSGLTSSACGRGEPDEPPAPSAGIGAAPADAPAAAPGDAAAPPPAEASAPIAAAPAPAAPPPAAAGTVIASTETNWPGIVAEVTEFRRKGNTLTARVRFRNAGPDRSEADINYSEVYLMDAGNARKYEALRDAKGDYIAALRSGYDDRWYETLEPGAQRLVWVKFPAPPPEVTSITLQLPGMPPFEDLPIVDG